MTARRKATVPRLPALLNDSALMLGTTVVMAVAGSLFWLIAAKVQPTEAVGVAASLITGIVVLSLLAQLGLNVTLIKVLPSSSHPQGDISWAVAATSSVGVLLGLLYALLVPQVAEELQVVRSSPWHILGFALLVGGTAANVTTDAAFLALRKLKVNLAINGGLMSLLKCGLPLLLVGLGPFGLLLSVGLASLFAAAASLTVLLIGLGPASTGSAFRPSAQLRDSLRFSGAGYFASVVDLIPILALPLIVISGLGSTIAGIYFVAFQVASLLNAGAFAIGGSMFAAGSRSPNLISETLRRSAFLMAGTVTVGVAMTALLAPHLMALFGRDYSAEGTAPLRLLALGSLAVAAQYWSVIFHRLSHNLGAMIAIPAVTSTSIVVLALTLVTHGASAVAFAWGAGYFIGAVFGLSLAARESIRKRPGRPSRRGGRHRRVADNSLPVSAARVKEMAASV